MRLLTTNPNHGLLRRVCADVTSHRHDSGFEVGPNGHKMHESQDRYTIPWARSCAHGTRRACVDGFVPEKIQLPPLSLTLSFDNLAMTYTRSSWTVNARRV